MAKKKTTAKKSLGKDKATSEKTSVKKKAVKSRSKKPKAKRILRTTPVSKPRKKSKSVVISSANVKERRSRPSFELVMSPWVCVPTGGPTDNGHDYTVEIISASSLDYKSDGKFFLTQLKSQAKLTLKEEYAQPHPLETRKIKQWYHSSSQMPFLYVVNDLSKNKFYYTWIDEEFITRLEKDSPFWTTQETVSIKIPVKNEILSEQLDVLREYVMNYRQAPKKILEPGVFFEMKDKVTAAINTYEKLVANTPYESVKKDVERLRSELDNAVYRIAITGLSRVGKSSLINNLLKRPDISPTNVWQTTGVPILFQPGHKETVQVNYLDAKRKPDVFDYSIEKIKEFASRDFNEENHKQVRDVTVHISSTQLERGVMFYDIPGLNDPNDTILDFAYHTADCANAILYIIDGALVASGSFVFSNEIKKQIERFSKKDRLFLVVNKVDKLELHELKGLKDEIERNLNKYNLKDKVSSKIYYLAVDPKEQEKLKAITTEISTPQELEEDLWAFMLTENKVGFFKMYSLMRELQQSTKKLEEIIRARSLDARDKAQLVAAIGEVRKKVPDLETYIRTQNVKIRRTIKANLELRKNGIIERLEKFLGDSKDMPSDNAIKNFLVSRGHHAVGSTKADVEVELGMLKDYIDKWIQDNLKQVREIIDLQGNNVEYSLKNIEEIQLPPFDFSSTWGTGIFAALAGFLINPVVGSFGVGLGIGGAIMDLIFGKEGRKAKRIRKMTQRAKTEYSKTFSEVEFSFNTAIDEQMNIMIDYVNRKLNLYFSDINKQVTDFKLDPNFDYVSFEKNSNLQIGNINNGLNSIWDELQQYLVVIRPL